MKLFVQIPAYRDSELSATLLGLYGCADHPSDIRTRVLWQRGEESLDRDVLALPNLEIIETQYLDSAGSNWARRQLQDSWDGEPFTLFLDSHHRFSRGWDTTTLDMYRSCLRKRNCIRMSAKLACLRGLRVTRSHFGRTRPSQSKVCLCRSTSCSRPET